MTRPSNLLTAPKALPQEQIDTLVATDSVRIERIISTGHTSPPGFWYDQPAAEWVLLLSGAARLRFEGEEPLELKPGDCINIPAHKRHRVEWTDPDQPTVWLAVHYTALQKPSFTPRQGQYLAFIHYYTKLNGQPPAEADMQRYFKTTPPSVHQMVLTLEKRGFIKRTPGKARSIKLLVERAQIPDLV